MGRGLGRLYRLCSSDGMREANEFEMPVHNAKSDFPRVFARTSSVDLESEGDATTQSGHEVEAHLEERKLPAAEDAVSLRTDGPHTLVVICGKSPSANLMVFHAQTSTIALYDAMVIRWQKSEKMH